MDRRRSGHKVTLRQRLADAGIVDRSPSGRYRFVSAICARCGECQHVVVAGDDKAKCVRCEAPLES